MASSEEERAKANAVFREALAAHKRETGVAGTSRLPLSQYLPTEEERQLNAVAGQTFRTYTITGALGGVVAGMTVSRIYKVPGPWRPAVVCALAGVIGYRLGVRTAAYKLTPELLALNDSPLADELRSTLGSTERAGTPGADDGGSAPRA